MAFKTKVPVLAGKAGTLALGAIAMGIGLYSHFASAWTKEITIINVSVKMYEFCSDTYGGSYITENIHCPSILLERFFVAIIIVVFILSVANGIAALLINMSTGKIRYLDMGYHLMAAAFLAIAAALYILSAWQIEDAGFVDFEIQPYVFKFLFVYKIIAGCVTGSLAFLNVGVALLILRF